MNPRNVNDAVDDVALDATAAEIGLAQRLDRLTAQASVDPGALDRILDRAADRSSHRHHRFQLLGATAAAVLVVAGIATVALSRDDSDSDDVRTGGGTTIAVDQPVRTTTTTQEPDDDVEKPPNPTPGPGPSSDGSDDAPETEDDQTGGPDPTTTTPPPAPRAEPLLTLTSADYTVEVVLDGSTLYFRRTDDVGSNPGDEPDAYGSAQMSSWGDSGGATCLTSGGGTFAFPDAAARSFTYGLAGSGISSVEIVLVGGGRVTAQPGPVAGTLGLRAWLVSRPDGEVDRIEGLDSTGQVVATITEIGGGDDFGYSLDTC